ncbi:MAG TPA: isoprenylcysteine carboxylmethyltransferase family protein [Urbifossiella sp.]|jgi:protein-S-isoprenylcysteine O-methyltransferase Ste14|nr:isoprenylcysteine carboxylmethyltransferase family protein [Urbifossiella sp.]
MSLNTRAWLWLAAVVVALGLLLFIPAGSADYWQAWAYLAVFAACAAAVTLYLMKYDPALLERRMHGGPAAETEPAQRVIMGVVSVAYVAMFVISGLDRRFEWSAVPAYAVAGGYALVVAGFAVEFLVFRENSFTSATIAVGAGQVVVSTGPYALVRHPMYDGALLMLLGTPPALGSWWGLLAFVPLAAGIVWRLLDEERFLSRNLPGYAAYCARVRSRLIPGIV